jgi:hypothetical protein
MYVMYVYIYVCMYLCMCMYMCVVGRDSSVGIATRYWLDGPGIESR